MSDIGIDKLQPPESSFYRQVFGAPKYAPNCTLRGEIGSSTMKKRIMEGKLTYMKNIMERDNQLLNNVLQTMKLEGYKSWMKTTINYLSVLNITLRDIEELSIKQIKAKLKEWDNREWENEIASKVSLSIYKGWKGTIGGKDIYDNRPASIILYKARANCLPLNDRKRHKNEPTNCDECKGKTEDIYHFILDCPRYSEERQKAYELQQPYRYEKDYIIGEFLFSVGNLEKNKNILYSFWKIRDSNSSNQNIARHDANTTTKERPGGAVAKA